jgi:hypothetical protein
MPRPYSAKTKRYAIRLCEMLASNTHLFYSEIVDGLGLDGADTAVRLADAAQYAIRKALKGEEGSWSPEVDGGIRMDWYERCAEAALLIKSGWRIGDPVEIPRPTTIDSMNKILQEVYSPETVSKMAEEGRANFAQLWKDEVEGALVQPIARDEVKTDSDAIINNVVDPPTEPSAYGEPGDYGSDS